MKAAQYSKRFFEKTKMLTVENSKLSHLHFGDLKSLLKPGDVLVVNQSATMPSSFRGRIICTNETVEIRLASFRGDSIKDFSRWSAVTFGNGDWPTPTEERGLAPQLTLNDKVIFSNTLSATITKIDAKFNRLIDIEFHADDLLRELYKNGRPIQYSYLREDLKIWDQQSIFSGPPISVEPPSASFAMTWQNLFDLEQRGIVITPLIHAAGLSSTGDAEFDKQFPLDEFYEIPQETFAKIENRKGRVIALGTTVTRALEAAFENGKLTARTNLRLGKTPNSK